MEAGPSSSSSGAKEDPGSGIRPSTRKTVGFARSISAIISAPAKAGTSRRFEVSSLDGAEGDEETRRRGKGRRIYDRSTKGTTTGGESKGETDVDYILDEGQRTQDSQLIRELFKRTTKNKPKGESRVIFYFP